MDNSIASRRSASRAVARRVSIIAAIAALVIVPRTARAQVALAVDISGGQQPNDSKRPFTLPSQTSDVAEALEDFGRYVKRAAWDRAFKSLQKVLEANPTGLVPDKEGFMLSVRTRLWQALAELPSDGKDAYRVFYDPEAKKLLTEATGKDELEKLNKVFSAYFATSVGDVAADRLGDLYFEQGELNKAAECWQAVLDYRPDTALSKPQLLVKTAIALARASRWREFRAVEKIVREKHAGEAVTLGGERVAAAAHVAKLAKAADATPAVSEKSPVAELKLPSSTDPMWQFRFFAPATAKALAGNDQNDVPLPTSNLVPPSAIDDTRVYVNLLGHFMAVDRVTGKLLWRTDSLKDLVTKVQQNSWTIRTEQYGIVAAGGKVFGVARGSKQVGTQNAAFRLVCLNGEDGKQLWTSETVEGMKEWNFCSSPVVTANRIYACCYKTGKGSELNTMAIDPKDGKKLWVTHVGTSATDENQPNYYSGRSAQPALVVHDDRVYVDSHNGALVALHAVSGNLVWGFAYDSEVVENRYWYGYQNASLTTAGTPIVQNGVLYFKGMRSPRLYAIQLAVPKLLWQRPITKSEMLAAIDGDRLFMSGEDVTAIDAQSKSLKWCAKLGARTGLAKIVVTPDRVFEFTSRGIYELDRATGDTVGTLFRGADLGSMGGPIYLTSDTIVTVSNVGVTAYSLRPTDSPAAAAAGAGSGSQPVTQKE